MSAEASSNRDIRTWADWEAAKDNEICTEAEKKLVDACLAGQDCSVGDGTIPDAPSPKNQIGSDLLRYLIKGGCDACAFHEWGINLSGAYVKGQLDLRLIRAAGVTGLRYCNFENSINAMNAKLEVLNLHGSRCTGLYAQGAEVTGDVFLRNGFLSVAEVNLCGAVIGGQLSCSGGRFENAKDTAFNAQNVGVKGSLILGNGFVANGGVDLCGAVIGGQLNCEGGRFENTKDIALNAQNVEVEDNVILANGFSANGAVNFSGAVIGGQLSCRGGRFEDAKQIALNAQGAELKGSVILSEGFSAIGEVSLSGAVIGGQLFCKGGRFENPKQVALSARSAEIKRDVFLVGGFSANGSVSFSGAVIGGQLSCNGGRFENTREIALDAANVVVSGDVFLVNGFVANGEVGFPDAVIGGQLSCSGGRFENNEQIALNAQGAEVKGSVFLVRGFSANGGVSFSGAVIGGQFSCSGGRFENAEKIALNAQNIEVKGGVFLVDGFSANGRVSLSNAVIGGQLACSGGSFENKSGEALEVQGSQMSEFFWINVKQFSGNLALSGAIARNLTDDANSWDLVHRSFLDGFTYQTIHGPLDAEMRLEWLRSACTIDGDFSPQPYEQLAWVLKRMGLREQRLIIHVEKERRQRRSARNSLRSRRRFASAVSRFSKFRNDADLETIQQQHKNMDVKNKAYAHLLLERHKLLHLSWSTHTNKREVHPSEIARAQTGFREQIFWENGMVRSTIAWLHIKDRLARYLVGYGYRPFNFIWALFLLIGLGWFVAYQAYERGDFAPNSAVILSTEDWQMLAEGNNVNPAKVWSSATGKGRDYETFQSFAYAVDVVIPIVSLGQEAAWAPSTNRGYWGQLLWWLRWVLIIAGWIVTAVGAAAITGMIRRE